MPRATNREVEIKLPIRDIHAVVRRLRSLGASSRGCVFEQNTLYDTPDSDLRRAGRLLRIRTETPGGTISSRRAPSRAIITSKAPIPGNRLRKPKHKERLERETAITRPERWPGALHSLGFRAGFRYEKFRTSFRLGKLHLDLDETPVGTFLELEGKPKVIDRVARSLGYAPRDYIRATYWEVFAADCRRRGITPQNMVFNRKKLAKSALFA